MALELRGFMGFKKKFILAAAAAAAAISERKASKGWFVGVRWAQFMAKAWGLELQVDKIKEGK